MKAGVISVQGAFPEHIDAFNRAFSVLGLRGEVKTIRRKADLKGVECVVLPGGESTTISKLLKRFELFDELVEMGGSGVPIMGTCAGCVLLSKEGDEQVEKTGTQLLGLMDMSVTRNAFGRQRESFEALLDVKGLDSPFPAVFIRAPAIESVWGRCEPCSFYNGRMVMSRQDNLLGLSFHPELCSDTRIHEMLVKMI
ncbi:MAG TPA: pyridoxal 5'-phosphate synthase glutaminase subunit PdxT [Methanomassiliicoccales archaeon]|nr:pyridoxal 5'-phosphate synthase glutaminase subunit PdxT [Methanomassiliicoccales archaeon]